MGQAVVQEWFMCLKEGQQSLDNDPGKGRPVVAPSEKTIAYV